MKNLFAMAMGMMTLLVTGSAFAQYGNTMGGGMSNGGWMGGYGGAWGPILLLVVVGLVVWIVQRRGK